MQALHLDTLVEVLMGFAILWLVGRGLRWLAWLGAFAMTLIVILGVLQARGGF